MTKLPRDYSRTIMYKIICNDLSVNFVYNGHTTDFIQRKSNHKSTCNNPKDRCYHLKVYKTIRENGGWENWTMIEIEKYPCKDGNEARTRERYWYEQLQSNLNIIVPSRSQKEYCQLNKDKIQEYKQTYYQENKAKLKYSYQIYHQENKDKIKEYHKEYRQKNKDNLLKYQQKYHLQTFTCECGSLFSISHKPRHEKSQKHLKYLETV
jgi:hypothetical protein